MFDRSFVRRLAAFVAALVFPAAAQAAPITFSFTITITHLEGNAGTLFPTLSIGDTISGQYTSDTSLGDEIDNPMAGAYRYLPSAGPFTTFVDVEGTRLSWSGSRILVTDTAVFDVYLFESQGTASLPAFLSTASFSGQLNGGGGGQLTSDGFPLTAPDASVFSSRSFSLWLGPDTGPNRIRGTVTAVSIAPPASVPEPVSLVLLGSGLVAVGARLRRTRFSR